MDATPPPPDPPEPTGRVSTKDSATDPPDPRNIIHAPNDDDDVDASSSVSDLITFGRHGLTQDGLATRTGYLWRRRAFKALFLLKQKPRGSRKKGDFGDLVESRGYSRSRGYKLAHIWPIISDVDKWAEIKADQSKRRRNGIEEWPSDEAILTNFPSPLKPTPRSREEKEEERRQEEEARARATANRNADGDDERLDVDAPAERVAALEAELEQERTARLNMVRRLAREREAAEAHNAALEQKAAPVTPEEPQVAEEVLSRDSDLLQLDLFAPPPTPDPDPDHDPRQLNLFAPRPDPDDPPPTDPPSVPLPTNPTDPIKPDPASIVLSADAVVPDERDEIERHYKLAAGWTGRSSPNGDILIRNIRAHFLPRLGRIPVVGSGEGRAQAPQENMA